MLGTTVLVEAKGLSFDSPVFILILANAVAFTGYLFRDRVGDTLERRNTVLGGFFLGGSASTIRLLGPNSAGFVISLYAVTLCFRTGPFSAMLSYMGESLPAHVRGIGSNLAHVMPTVGAIVGSAVVSIMP